MINVSDWLVDDESAAHRVSPDAAAAAEELERPPVAGCSGGALNQHR